jgi:hypothetical protein
MKPTQIIIALVVTVVILGAAIAFMQLRPVQPPLPVVGPSENNSPAPASDPSPGTVLAEVPSPLPANIASKESAAIGPIALDVSSEPTNKLQRLTRTRELFRKLAAGNPVTALRAAKEITDETEREAALFTLVEEWTQGELSPPRRRAYLINAYGLEAGLGVELAKYPELAALWADEMTEGPGRLAVFQQIAREMVGSDPAAAFSLSDRVPPEERATFHNALFAFWAESDTDAAMRHANQLPDPGERDAAIEAIRTVAPVGIGAALRLKDGYPIINELWQRDICGEEPELLDGNMPLGAVPQKTGTLTMGHLLWSYKRGEQTRVQSLRSEKSQKYWFLDIERGHEIGKIPEDAFRFIE